jgi:hypothetical protein
MLRSVPIAAAHSQHILGDVVPDEDRNYDQVRLHPTDVFAEHASLAVRTASTDASVDHANIAQAVADEQVLE